MTPPVIALVGPRRSGKDTLASLLGALAPVARFQIADPIKEGVAAMFGISRAELEGPEKDQPRVFPGGATTTPRSVMQRLGTEFAMGALGETVWIDQCVSRVRLAQMSDPRRMAVITDVRFPHEIRVLRETFGPRLLTVRVSRQAAPGADPHRSETAHAEIPADMVVRNDGGFQELAWRAYAVTEAARKRVGRPELN